MDPLKMGIVPKGEESAQVVIGSYGKVACEVQPFHGVIGFKFYASDGKFLYWETPERSLHLEAQV